MIIYLDEIWYDTPDTLSKGWTDKLQNFKIKVTNNIFTRGVIRVFLAPKNILDCNLDYNPDTKFFNTSFKTNYYGIYQLIST